MAYICDEGRKIINGADEHYAKNDPQNAGKPTKLLRGQNGPSDGTRCGDGAEMLAQQIKRFGGDKIYAVVDLMSRSGGLVAQRKNPRDELSVESVAQEKRKHHENGK